MIKLRVLTYAQKCSAMYFCAYALVGAALSSLGPSLIDLASQTHSDIGGISFVFPVRSVAYLVGSAIGGPGFDRFPGHYLFGIAMTLACIGTSTIPFCRSVITLAVAASVQGLAIGFLDTGSNVLLVWVHGDAKVAPYMQFIHFAFGIGAFVAPLLVDVSVRAIGTPSLAFWLNGALFAPLVVGLLLTKSPRPPAGEGNGEEGKVAKRLGPREYVLVAIAAFLMFVYVGTEIGEGSFIYTYAVVYAGFSEHDGHYLTSVFWGCLALGRLIAVPVSMYVKARMILLFNFSGSLVAVALIAAYPQSTVMLWVCTVIYGLCMSCIFPTVVNMLQAEVALTGKLTSALVISGAVGEMVVPLALAVIFEGDTDKFIFLIYILIAGAVLSLAGLAAFIVLARRRRLIQQQSYLQLQVDDVQMDDEHETSLEPTSSLAFSNLEEIELADLRPLPSDV